MSGTGAHDAADVEAMSVVFADLVASHASQLDRINAFPVPLDPAPPGRGGAGRWTRHVHAPDIGVALDAALGLGRPRNVRVEPLHPGG